MCPLTITKTVWYLSFDSVLAFVQFSSRQLFCKLIVLFIPSHTIKVQSQLAENKGYLPSCWWTSPVCSGRTGESWRSTPDSCCSPPERTPPTSHPTAPSPGHELRWRLPGCVWPNARSSWKTKQHKRNKKALLPLITHKQLHLSHCLFRMRSRLAPPTLQLPVNMANLMLRFSKHDSSGSERDIRHLTEESISAANTVQKWFSCQLTLASLVTGLTTLAYVSKNRKQTDICKILCEKEVSLNTGNKGKGCSFGLRYR